MKRHSWIHWIIVILSFAFIPTFVSALSTQGEVEGPIKEKVLNNVHTLTRVDDTLYAINHLNRDGLKEKRLYRKTNEDSAEFELVYATNGSLSVDDSVFSFGDNIYMTVSRKRGKKVEVYRSSDQGLTWENVGKVGFKGYMVKNQVEDVFVTDERFYIVIGQEKRFDSRDKKVGVWSSKDGERWKKRLVSWNAQQSYAGYGVLNSQPFLFLNGTSGSEEEAEETTTTARVYAPAQANGWKFVQVGVDNIREASPTTEVEEVKVFSGLLFVRAYNTAQATWQTLVSTDGETWTKAATRFAQFTPFGDTIFTTRGQKLFTSSDGEYFYEASLSFEDELSTIILKRPRRLLNTTAGQSHIHARVWRKEKTDQEYCAVSEDALEWIEVECTMADAFPSDESRSREVVVVDDVWYFTVLSDAQFKLWKIDLSDTTTETTE